MLDTLRKMDVLACKKQAAKEMLQARRGAKLVASIAQEAREEA